MRCAAELAAGCEEGGRLPAVGGGEAPPGPAATAAALESGCEACA